MKISVKHIPLFSLALLGVIAAPNQAQATLVTFDDLTGYDVPYSYEGLNWSNFYSPQTAYIGTGYANGIVSPTRAAYNGFGTTASVHSSTAFTFTSGYFTGFWNDSLTVSLVGYLDGGEKYSTSFTVDSTAPTFVELNWAGIDMLTISSSGGTNAGYYVNGSLGIGTHVVMDNLLFTPIPAALPLFGAALVGLGGLARRRKAA